MESLWQDLRYGFRMLLKSYGFTLVAILSLALGIGANTAIFSIINGIFLKPLPIAAPNEVICIYGTDEKNAGGRFDYTPISYPNYLDYRDRASSFSQIALFGFANVTFSGKGEAQQLNGLIVSGNYFDLLGIKPFSGRFFLPEETRTEGTHPVVVLSYGAWQRQFGGDKNIVGSTITLNKLGFTVIGIAPENFRGTFAIGQQDFWLPTQMHNQVLTGATADFFNVRRALLFDVIGRLKPGVARAQAESELKTIAAQLAQQYPKDNDKRSITTIPITQGMIDPNTRENFVLAGILLMTVVVLVLLIACANIANLLLARATARRTEIAIRLAMGADRWRLIRQLLTESLMLSLTGGFLGLLIAVWSLDLLWLYRPAFLQQNAVSLSIDKNVLGFTILISVLTGIIFGLAPALQLSKQNLITELKYRTVQLSGNLGFFSLRNMLVVAQVALSLIALIGAGLFLKSLHKAEQIDAGFDTRQTIMLSFDIGTQGYDEVRGAEFFRNAITRVQAIPGISSAAVSSNAPLGGGFQRSVFIEGQDNPNDKGVLVLTNNISTGYLETLGITLLKGRGFNEIDQANSPQVVIINETMARRFWPNQDAIGNRFKFFGDDSMREVVGIVRDSKYQAITEEARSCAYIPLTQNYVSTVTLYARVAGEPKKLIPSMRQQVQELNPNLALLNVQEVSAVVDQSLWAPRMSAILLGIFGLLALILAAVGLYGVLSYSINQRRHEIGIRMALGAQRSDVLKMVLKQAMTLVMIGVSIGLIAGFMLAQLFGSLLIGVSGSDPATFLTTPVILMIVALLASYIPARKATKVDPMVALRYE